MESSAYQVACFIAIGASGEWRNVSIANRSGPPFFPHISLSIDNLCQTRTTLARARQSVSGGGRRKSGRFFRVCVSPKNLVRPRARPTANRVPWHVIEDRPGRPPGFLARSRTTPPSSYHYDMFGTDFAPHTAFRPVECGLGRNPTLQTRFSWHR